MTSPQPTTRARTQPSDAPAKQQPPKDPAQLLDYLLSNTSERIRVVDDALFKRVGLIDELLPDRMRGQGRRLAKRASMTMGRDANLKDCPLPDFVRCVLEAAELGLSIDGKFGYVVRYKSRWQFQADYKALVAVARRNGLIKDCYARIVRENDQFEFGEDGDHCYLRHTFDPKQQRGNVIGAYCKVILPDGVWRVEFMDIEELEKIRQRAPAKNGPWATDREEMQKKTVIRRAMKMYSDDPGFARAMADPWEEDDRTVPQEDRPRANGKPQPLAHGEIPVSEPEKPDPALSADTRKELQRLILSLGLSQDEVSGLLTAYFAENIDQLSEKHALDFGAELSKKLEEQTAAAQR